MKNRLSRSKIASPVLMRVKSNEEVSRSSPTIEYFWKSSIPESWKKIIEKKKISCVPNDKKKKNTLMFLQETQKYISNICKKKHIYEKDQQTINSNLCSQTSKLSKSLSESSNLLNKFSKTGNLQSGKNTARTGKNLIHPDAIIKLKKNILKKRLKKKIRPTEKAFFQLESVSAALHYNLSPKSRFWC